MKPVQLPIFPSSDFDSTAAFYELLSFSEVTRFGSNYLILEHPVGIELHFYGAGRVRTRANDHAVYIRFETGSEAETLHASWAKAVESEAFAEVAGKTGRLLTPTDTDYGLREFALLDNDGNLLRIGGSIVSE